MVEDQLNRVTGSRRSAASGYGDCTPGKFALYPSRFDDDVAGFAVVYPVEELEGATNSVYNVMGSPAGQLSTDQARPGPRVAVKGKIT